MTDEQPLQPKVLNFDEELAAKLAAKYDPEDEKKAIQWLETVSGMSVGQDFYRGLKTGVILCKTMLKLQPGSISSSVWTPKPKHYLDEKSNIKAFLNAAAAFGVESSDLFNELDLGDLKPDLQPVVNCIFALSRTAQMKRIPDIPVLGPTYYRSEEDNARIRARKIAEAKAYNEAKAKYDEQSRVRREELETEIKVGSQRRKVQLEDRRRSRKLERENSGVYDRKSPPRKEAEHDVELKFGFDKEQRERMTQKFEDNHGILAHSLMNWIEEVTSEVVDDFQLHLKSGRTLCRLVNRIQELVGEKPLIPERKINSMANKMKETQNIQMFLDTCEAFGITSRDLFLPTDLYDSKDLGKVARTLKLLAEKTSAAYDKKFSKVPSFNYVEQKPVVISDPALQQRREQDRSNRKARIDGLLKTGLDAFRASRFPEAMRAFDDILSIEKENLQAQFFKGKIYFSTSQFPASSRCFAVVVQNDSENVEAHLIYGQSLAAEERFDDAIGAFDRVLQLNPKDKVASEERAKAVKAKSEIHIPMPEEEPQGGSWLRTGAFVLGGVAVGAAVCYLVYRNAPEKVDEVDRKSVV